MAEQTITISLETKEMMYDVQNKTYLTGRSREAENQGNYQAASQMQASDDDENAYQIRRSLQNAFSEIKTEFADYLDEEGTTGNNKIVSAIEDDEALVLSLKMPSNYNENATAGIANGLHQYMVNKAVFDWFEITNKVDAADYMAMAKDALNGAKRALYKRARPTKPTYSGGSGQ